MATEEVSEPAPASVVVDKGDHLQVTVGKMSFTVETPAQGSQERALYEALSDEDKARFNEKRAKGVALVARALNALKYGLGFGSILKEKFVFWRSDRSDDRALENLRAQSPSVKEEVTAIVERDRAARFARQNDLVKRTMRERSEVIVASIVRNFDASIWAQAPVYSHSNEHAFYGALGVGGLGKTGSKHKLGGLLELGFSIGYNTDTKAVVFQFIRDVESFRDSAIPMMVFGGVYFKLGYYFANQTQKGHLSHRGNSFYPPILPGFTTTTADVVIVGMNAGVPFMTFPPSPFDNGLTYLNGAKPDAILRITISPKTLGFIRIQTLPLKTLVEPVTSAVRAVSNRLVGRGGACPRLFTAAGG